jgi:hypothetical protein
MITIDILTILIRQNSKICILIELNDEGLPVEKFSFFVLICRYGKSRPCVSSQGLRFGSGKEKFRS